MVRLGGCLKKRSPGSESRAFAGDAPSPVTAKTRHHVPRSYPTRPHLPTLPPRHSRRKRRWPGRASGPGPAPARAGHRRRPGRRPDAAAVAHTRARAGRGLAPGGEGRPSRPGRTGAPARRGSREHPRRPRAPERTSLVRDGSRDHGGARRADLGGRRPVAPGVPAGGSDVRAVLFQARRRRAPVGQAEVVHVPGGPVGGLQGRRARGVPLVRGARERVLGEPEHGQALHRRHGGRRAHPDRELVARGQRLSRA